MRNFEQRICELRVSQLERLDTFVDNSALLEEAMAGKGGDSMSDDEQLLAAAEVLYGDVFNKTLCMLRPTQPGYYYVLARKRIHATLGAR